MNPLTRTMLGASLQEAIAIIEKMIAVARGTVRNQLVARLARLDQSLAPLQDTICEGRR